MVKVGRVVDDAGVTVDSVVEETSPVLEVPDELAAVGSQPTKAKEAIAINFTNLFFIYIIPSLIYAKDYRKNDF